MKVGVETSMERKWTGNGLWSWILVECHRVPQTDLAMIGKYSGSHSRHGVAQIWHDPGDHGRLSVKISHEASELVCKVHAQEAHDGPVLNPRP